METKVAAVTMRLCGAEFTVPKPAVTIVVPVATEVASPLEPKALLTVAIDPALEAQVTCVVRFCVELSV
jgi:hypothetical protein